MKVGRALLFVIPFSLASSIALAEEAPQKGLVVFVDPVTGKVRQPDPAEIGALTAPKPGTEAVKPAAEPPLEVKYGSGGAVGLVLDGRFESFMVVTKTPDGKLAMDCVTGGKQADEAVAAGAKAAGNTGKKKIETARKVKKENEEAVRVP